MTICQPHAHTSSLTSAWPCQSSSACLCSRVNFRVPKPEHCCFWPGKGPRRTGAGRGAGVEEVHAAGIAADHQAVPRGRQVGAAECRAGQPRRPQGALHPAHVLPRKGARSMDAGSATGLLHTLRRPRHAAAAPCSAPHAAHVLSGHLAGLLRRVPEQRQGRRLPWLARQGSLAQRALAQTRPCQPLRENVLSQGSLAMCACRRPEQHAWQTMLQARRRAGVAQRNRQGHAARGSDLVAPRCRALSDLGGTGGPGGPGGQAAERAPAQPLSHRWRPRRPASRPGPRPRRRPSRRAACTPHSVAYEQWRPRCHHLRGLTQACGVLSH